jgi:hypothetical protein
MRHAILHLSVLISAFGCAHAQNTGGVFPPMVQPNTSAAEYRIGFRPGADGQQDTWAQRLHYQTSLDGDFLFRIVGQVADRVGEDAEFDLVQAELFWDLSEDDARWRTGLRFDGVVRGADGPEQINVNWTNQIALTEAWNARFVVLTSRQFGDRAADGVLLETRSNIFTDVGGITVGVESYNLHGSTADFDAFGGRQQVGPFAFIPVGDGGLQLFTGVLFGANERSPDTDLRFWVTKNF